MKYALLPEVRDLRPGNAAIFYYRSHSPEWEQVLSRHPDRGHFHEWLDLPLKQAPVEKVMIAANMLKELDIAARTEHCDWQILTRLREESLTMLVPDIQAFRTSAVLVALRARLEMRDRNLNRAIYSLQTGLAMSKHVGEAPYLVAYLVGAATAFVTLDRVEEFIQQPDAPNLYWALTDLPRPLIDLRRPLQGERIMIDGMLPEIRQALNDPRAGPIPVPRMAAQMEKLSMLGRGGPEPVAWAVIAAKTYPRARAYLLSHGWTPQAVDAMPVSQVALMYNLAKLDRWDDEAYKLNNLPYWQASTRLKELNDRATNAAYRADLGVLSVLGSGSLKMVYTKARLQRRIDLLRCVEAVRLYAATHQGTLPAALDDIRDVPIPDDPVTGKAFGYTVSGGRAILTGPPPLGEEAYPHNAVRIEITLAAPQKAK
jgi:hypothetical protein